jgi:GTP-binding protein YchF
MNISLIGLPKAGKTTIFNALTGAEAPVAAYTSQKEEPNVAVVKVLDHRVGQLSKMYNPKKTVHAAIQLTDPTGTDGSDPSGGPFSAEILALLRKADALATVIRNFRDESLEETMDRPDPQQDLETIETELLLSDQIIVERRLERIESDYRRGLRSTQSQAEEKLLRTLLAELENGVPIRSLELTPVQKKTISGFRFLTEKPLLLILNTAEESYGKSGPLLEQLGHNHDIIEFAGSFEMELSRLEPEEAAAFLADLGIEESARARLTTFAYRALGYISFFTVGEDEVRAWKILDGEKAVAAAGVIHSDLARGFIRAERFSFNDLITCGSERELKGEGLIRLEGKEYVVKDGDILSIRFSV